MNDTKEPQVNYAEALFAAQTMVHRLRRVTLIEAIDLEFEDPSIPPNIGQITQSYIQWMEKFDHTLSQVLKNYQPHSEDEGNVKGEVTLLTLTTILYCLTVTSYDKLTTIRPLLVTIASALAVTAARLRFTPRAIPDPSPNTQPVVKMIHNALNIVHQVVACDVKVYSTMLYTCMSAIPDSILAGSGSGGGAYGRMSMDPRCFTAVTTEIRTQGLTHVWESFIDLPAPEDERLIMFLNMCRSWAHFVPLPHEFVRRSVSLVEMAFIALSNESPNEQQILAGRSAMGYWIAIMEGGSWSVDQVLAASLIQKHENNNQPNKKRQSSKSKRRQKEVLEERTTQNQYILAQNEVQHRADIACEVTMRTWQSFQPLLARELLAITSIHDEVQGDGPVGGAIACANSCLPYLLKQRTHTVESMHLFVSIGNAVQEVCSSPNRSVRSFAAESLYKLHEVVISVGETIPSFGSEMDSIIVDHFFKCAMNLALRCGYPTGYFEDLGADNDEELESERNDVRDVLRGITGNTSSHKDSAGANITSRLLIQLMKACASPMQEIKDNPSFPESALHAFSALAKPLNSMAVAYLSSPSHDFKEVLDLCLDIISVAGQSVIQGLSRASTNQILPLSRLYSLAVASLSPMLSALASTQVYETSIRNILGIGIEASVLSLIHLPELTGPSTLRSTRYDIRGAMRSPGGEDHVAVLTLMRLAKESKLLTTVFLQTKSTVVVDLCHLYQEMKRVEIERGFDSTGQSILYGKGVLPKSRRILLGVICHLEFTTGVHSASEILKEIFESSVMSIADLGEKATNGHFTGLSLSQICETVFDLAAFSKNVVETLFNFTGDEAIGPRAKCLRVLHYTGVYGFKAISDPSNFTPHSLFHWNRLRAALFMLIKASGSPDLPFTAIELVLAGISTECDAILLQCKAGPKSTSLIFQQDLISEESIPSGTFVEALGDILERGTESGIPLTSLTNVLRILFESRVPILSAISAECPNPIEKDSFYDPRPTLAESWFLTMNRLMKAIINQRFFEIEGVDYELSKALKHLLIDSCVSIIGLLLYPSLGKTQIERANDPGMSFDGPQTLAMMEFLQLFFTLGLTMLQSASIDVLKNVPIDPASVQNFSSDPNAVGVAIVGAALFRAVQGGLPPWAVECIPVVYSSFYQALNKDAETFGLLFEMSMNIRLANNQNFGGVQASCLLSGRSFETMSLKARQTFVSQAVEFAKRNDANSWRSLKALIKKECGGKKKDTDFKQKPAFTKWDALDRV